MSKHIFGEIKVPIFDQLVVFSSSSKKLKKRVGENCRISGEEWAAMQKVETEKGPVFCLYLPKEWCLRTTVHECLHCTYEILARVGVPVDFDNQETVAYLQDYLVDKTYQAYKERGGDGD